MLPLQSLFLTYPSISNPSLSSPWKRFSRRCCYITVDSAMAALQKGFCSHKLSIHKKTNIKYYADYYIIFYHREIVKLDHFTTFFFSYANTVLWRSRCKIHRFVAAPSRQSRQGYFYVNGPPPAWVLWFCWFLPVLRRTVSGVLNKFANLEGR